MHQSAEQSSAILRVLDRACQRWVLVLCLDEIFFHREPILMGVEPISLAWLAGQRGPDRSGESWSQVIEQWPNLEHVIADGGQGLERGVKLANAARREAQESETEAPVSITMGLDVFHTQREVERVLQRVWKRVEGQIEVAVKADAKVAQAKRRGQDTRGLAGRAGRAWRQAERLFDEAVQAQKAVEQITEALGWFDASGHLYAREQAQKQLDEAIPQLRGEAWGKAKRMLKDARTLSHLDRLHEQRPCVFARTLALGGADAQVARRLGAFVVLTESPEAGRGGRPCLLEPVGGDGPPALRSTLPGLEGGLCEGG